MTRRARSKAQVKRILRKYGEYNPVMHFMLRGETKCRIRPVSWCEIVAYNIQVEDS